MSGRSSKKEYWRPVPGYPLYEASSWGNVRSRDHTVIRKGRLTWIRGKELKQKTDHGYKTVMVYAGGKHSGKNMRVHRLVALAFISNPENLPFINHKDENRTNNRPENLEWCTHEYNVNYGTAIERRVKNQDWQSIADKQSYDVIQCERDGTPVKAWRSAIECERETEFDASKICACIRGERKTHGGYTWKRF